MIVETLYYLFLLALAFFFLMLVPLLAILNNFAASLFFYLYKLTHQDDPTLVENPRKFWEWPVTILMKIWYWHGRIWHGFEIHGLENIPKDEGALLISYHSVAPIDAVYLLSNIYLAKKRKVVAIVDRMAFQLPGYRSFLEALEHQTGTVESCVKLVRDRSELVLIYPGGTGEAMLSDQNYELVWPERAGFGKIAHLAKNKIIPIFTQNVREIIQPLGFRDHFRHLYRTRKLAYKPILGWFPVKLKAYIGKPVDYSPDDASVEEIVKLTKQSLEALIRRHQKIPGSVPRALVERLTS